MKVRHGWKGPPSEPRRVRAPNKPGVGKPDFADGVRTMAL